MFLPLEVPRVLTYLSRYIDLSGCVPPHSKGHKIVDGSVVVQHQPSLLCSRLEQSQLLVAVPVAMQRQVPTFQKFENSGSSTVTVLDKFVGFQPHCISNTSMSICQAVGSGSCSTWSVKLLGGRVHPTTSTDEPYFGSHAVPYSVTLEDFLRRFKTCKTHLQLSELSGSRM